MVAKYVPWPPNSGDKRRTLAVARSLRTLGPVTLCAFAGPDETVRELVDEGIDVRCVVREQRLLDMLRGFLQSRSLTAARFWSAELKALVDDALAEGVGVVCVSHVQLQAYLDPELAGGARTVLDMHNIESLLTERYGASQAWPKRLVMRVEAMMLRRLERRAVDYDIVSVVSELDRAQLATEVDHPRVLVVPNAWDAPVPLDAAEGPVVSFVALMSWAPNVDAAAWFCEHVWPLVSKEVPGAQLQLVGRNPTDVVRRLAGPTITVTGTVEDLDPWYERTRVAVAPLRAGGGSRLKILEALAAGRPVVATSVGAEGLEDLEGRGLVIADDPGEMAVAISGLLLNPTVATDLGRAGVAAISSDHSWTTATRELLLALQSPAG